MAVPAVSTPLSSAAGYGLIVGLGTVFAVAVLCINHINKSLLKRQVKLEVQNVLGADGPPLRARAESALPSEATEFSVASRSLGVGLSASAAVSAWCWSVTLLSSCTTAYQNGVAGALFYGAGNMVQIAIFSLFAIQLKRIAPHVHTHLEMLHARYGTASHLTLLFFALITNLLVSSSILIGSSAAIHSISGVNTYACLFLLPTAVAAYTLTGGLRSTILADYLHTTIILVITLILFSSAYIHGSQPLGSPERMYALLVQKAEASPSRNFQGSYLTIKSLDSVKFAWLSLIEYTATFVNDASSHQKGIAAKPRAAVPGYLLGSLAWFAIPWTLATTAGLSALALETTSPRFPTFPRRMTQDEVSAGLVLPYAAHALLGTGGSVCVLLLMFMSSTSAISSQMIAVSSIVGYDVFAGYLVDRGLTSSKSILVVQQSAVLLFGLLMAAFSSLLHGVNVDLGFLFNTTGVASACTLPVLSFAFFSTQVPAWCIFPGTWIVLLAGLAVWFGLADRFDETISIHSLSDINVDLYTYTTCLATGIGVCLLGRFLPVRKEVRPTVSSQQQQMDLDRLRADDEFRDPYLKNWLYIAIAGVCAILAVFMFIWPLSLYRDYVFTQMFFTGWVVVSGLWTLASIFLVVLWPIV